MRFSLQKEASADTVRQIISITESYNLQYNFLYLNYRKLY